MYLLFGWTLVGNRRYPLSVAEYPVLDVIEVPAGSYNSDGEWQLPQQNLRSSGNPFESEQGLDD